jgi:hypothetical protein
MKNAEGERKGLNSLLPQSSLEEVEELVACSYRTSLT